VSFFNKTGKRILIVFVLFTVATFLFGLFAFNWYLSTDDFAAQLETMRSKLKQRGIRFGSVSVGKLGQIELTDFQVDLGDLGTISLVSLKGRLEFASLLSGEVKTILDVTDIVSQYLKLRFDKKLSLNSESKIQFSFGGDIRALRTGKGLNGDVYLDDCKLKVQKLDTVISVDGVTLPVTTPGPVVSFPSVEVMFDDRVTTVTGSIRNILRNPEFVDTTMAVNRTSLLKPIQDLLKGLHDKEVSRKILMYGNAEIKIVVNGPILAPHLNCSFDVPDYVLDFRGTHRQISVAFEGLKGELSWLGTMDDPQFSFDLEAHNFLCKYSKINESHLPPLNLRGTSVSCRALYKKRMLNFQKLIAKLYDGTFAGKISCDLTQAPLAYNFALVGKGLHLNNFLADICNKEGFINGNVDFILNGKGQTLKIEYITADGKASLKDFRVLGFPDSSKLPLPAVKKNFPDLRFNNTLFDFGVKNGLFNIPKMQITGKDAVLDSATDIDLLKLDLHSAYRFTLNDQFIDKFKVLATELPDKRLDIKLDGLLMNSYVTYAPATISSQ
jgi:hypothetical protein